MLNQEYKLFNFNNKYFVFDYINIIIFEISKELYLDMLDTNEESKEYLEFMQFLRDNDLCSDSEERFEKINNRIYDVASISFPSEHTCNLACNYCFANAGKNYDVDNKKMTNFMIESIMEKVYTNYFAKYETIKIDFVSGGEPLINFNIIESTVKIAKKMDQQLKKKSEIFLCTNATLLTEDIIRFIDENNIKLGISLDGIKEENDANRIYPNGDGSYDKIIYWINYIKNCQELSSKTRDLLALSVVTNETKSIVENLKLFYNLGIRNVQFKLCRSDKGSSCAINSRNVDRIINLYEDLNVFLIDEIKKGNLDYLLMILNDNDYYGKIIRRIILREPSIRRCEIGRNKLSFTSSGEIFPCDPFMGVKEFCMGNITHSKIERSYWENITFKQSKRCSECWLRYICSGDCYHNSHLVENNLFEPDKDYCLINNRLVEFSLELIYTINENKEMATWLEKFLQIKEKIFV